MREKRFLKLILTGLFLVLAITIYPQATVKVIQGFAQSKENTSADWKPLKVGDKLQNGSIIYTGFKSTVIVQTVNATIEIKPLTQMTLASIIASENKITTDLELKYGKVKAEVNTNKETQTLFKVRSANSTASVRGTSFTFGEDELFVNHGTVLFTTDSNISLLVQKNESSSTNKFGETVRPMQHKFANATVTTTPVGTSSGESDMDNNLTTRRTQAKGNIIINIKVTGGNYEW